MRVALYPNVRRDVGFEWTDQLINAIANRGGTAYLLPDLMPE